MIKFHLMRLFFAFFVSVNKKDKFSSFISTLQSNRQHNRYITHVRANMKRREDGAVREVMKELLRSDLRFHKTDCGRFGAMTAWGLKDTSSRPAKDLGGTLRHTIRTVLRSYDSRASGDLLLYRSIGLIMPIFVRG